jgi:hypothetical protein
MAGGGGGGGQHAPPAGGRGRGRGRGAPNQQQQQQQQQYGGQQGDGYGGPPQQPPGGGRGRGRGRGRGQSDGGAPYTNANGYDQQQQQPYRGGQQQYGGGGGGGGHYNASSQSSNYSGGDTGYDQYSPTYSGGRGRGGGGGGAPYAQSYSGQQNQQYGGQNYNAPNYSSPNYGGGGRGQQQQQHQQGGPGGSVHLQLSNLPADIKFEELSHFLKSKLPPDLRWQKLSPAGTDAYMMVHRADAAAVLSLAGQQIRGHVISVDYSQSGGRPLSQHERTALRNFVQARYAPEPKMLNLMNMAHEFNNADFNNKRFTDELCNAVADIAPDVSKRTPSSACTRAPGVVASAGSRYSPLCVRRPFCLCAFRFRAPLSW